MDLKAVYAEIETKLRTITGLRVVKMGEKPQVPGAMVLLPDSIVPANYGRGSSVVRDVVVLVIVGRAVARQAQADVFAYAASSGSKSVHAVLDPATWVACFDVAITEVTFDTVTIAGAQDVYLGVLFHLDITGPGA